MNKMIILLSLLSFNAFSQDAIQELTTVEHWNRTKLTISDVISDSINPIDCVKNEDSFIGCMYALNTSLDINDPKNTYFLSFDSASKKPFNGFSAKAVSSKTPNINELKREYSRELKDVFAKIQEIFLPDQTLIFKDAIDSLKEKFDGVVNESYYAGLIYNSYLSTVYDPHTYIIPLSISIDSSKDIKTRKGFGLDIQKIDYQNTPHFLIKSVVNGSPADLVGIEAGDIFLRVNSKEKLEEVSKELSNDIVTVTVEGAKGRRDIVLKKGIVSRPQVQDSIITSSDGKKYGLIKLQTFRSSESCKEIQIAGMKFRAASVDGVILDLRGNGGGSVSVARCIMSLYLEEESLSWLQKIVYTPENFGISKAKLTNTLSLFSDIHTVTLINGQSASASEALALYLQGYRKSFILGEKSFGKGTMQITRQSSLAKGLIEAVTTAKFYGPQGNSPQLSGVTPDFKVYPVYGQTNDTPYEREVDLYFNPKPNENDESLEMPERTTQINEIDHCMKEQNIVNHEYEALDSFKKRIFDQQIAAAKAVLRCATDLKIPIFQDINIPFAKKIN